MPSSFFRSFFLLALTLCLVGCAKPPAGASSTSTDPSNTQESESDLQRFAVFSPALGVILRDLGFEDSIVGKHTYDTALSNSIEVVGSHVDIDYEMLITIEPTDLFFERNTIEIPERLRELADENAWQIWIYELKTLDDIASTLDDLYLKLVGFPEKVINDENLFDLNIDPTAQFDVELPSARLANAWSPLGRAASEAGRTLVLASVDPPGAMGPGSFHAQLIGRLGLSSALVEGGMWQELDYEDIIDLAPDSILVFMPKANDAQDLIGEPLSLSWDEILAKVGGLGELPTPARDAQRIAIIEHPLGLLPSSSFGEVADEVSKTIRSWSERAHASP